jgi:hypothetical protein
MESAMGEELANKVASCFPELLGAPNFSTYGNLEDAARP